MPLGSGSQRGSSCEALASSTQTVRIPLMPAVTTALCIAFIFLLLRRSSKCEPRLSFGLWIPTIWIGIMLSRPITYWFDAVPGGGDQLESSLDGSPIERNVLIFLMVAGLAVLLARRVNWSAVF